MTRAAPVLLLLLAAACAIKPEPPSPDPIAGGGLRREGKLEGASPAQLAFCVSQEVQPSLVVLPPDGAAVRPARTYYGQPDYALTLRRAEGGVAWVRQVAEAEPAAAAAVAARLDGALDACAERRSDGA